MIHPDEIKIERPPSRSKLRSPLVLTLVFVLGGFIIPNIHISWRWPHGDAEVRTGLGVTAAQPPGALSPAESYARAAQAAAPAVVNIDTRKIVRIDPGAYDDDWMLAPRYKQVPAEGSGVIVNSGGDILTNEHVVGAVGESNRTIQVTTMDGRKFEGTVIGSDHATDVALVHINGTNLKVARVGTVVGLIPGQMAVAIGNPYGLRFTVTHGVVSALDRPVHLEDRVYERLIQTDCAINPGNSGGPLVNLNGEVIGINTVVFTGGQGIGFAIPIDTALRVADELKRFGMIKRPWLGIVVLTNSPRLAQANALPNVLGIVAYRMQPNGPSEAAGIQPRDVITTLDGKPVPNEESYKEVVKTLRIGQKVAFEMVRGEKSGKGTIVVGTAPASVQQEP